ncbi:uncharacterized protein [Engystomops pustulosus]|uniref:uncharacterized protein n=1 Tax=Engystomops pustulosus TaxID=76066 RepID=UPI003AFA55E8
MVLMPQLLYILHNTPVWIPFRIFYGVQGMFRELLWKKGHPRIKLETLQRAKDNGGLAIPNPWIYFLAAQAQQLRGWAQDLDGAGPNGRLVSIMTGMVPPITAIEIGKVGTISGLRCPTLALMAKTWSKIKSILGVKGNSEYFPIWHNPKLPEMFRLEGFSPWEGKGIWFLHQLLEGETFKSFEQLQESFHLTHTQFYKFLQLRHASEKTIKDERIQTSNHSVLKIVVGGGSSKGIISCIYSRLLEEYLKEHPLNIKEKWEADLGEISDTQWDVVLESIPSLSPSEAQRLSQIYILHRVYKTPSLLHKIGLRNDSCCPRCSAPNAKLFHMMWECKELEEFWKQVLHLIRKVLSVDLEPDPRACLLGLIESDTMEGATLLCAQKMLYLARKAIAARWIQALAPTAQEFINKVNNIIRLEWGVYLKRKCPKKFDKIWGRWLGTAGLPNKALIDLRNSTRYQMMLLGT